MKILVVDDDKVTLEAVSFHLRNAGYEVLTADDGMSALEIIKSKKLDLIISDIMMPNMSGLELLNLLKRFYFNSIPVILFSTLDNKDIIITSLSLGAEDFITKPVNFDELIIRVKKISK